MIPLFDSRGQAIRIGRKLGSGGEGIVYELLGNPKLVAKVYHRPRDGDAADKLRVMTALATDDLIRSAALPVATLAQVPGGPIAGVLLPHVRGHAEIHTLYSPAHRKSNYPDKDWAFLIHVAMNVAAVFDSLHEKSIVIGDVNQGNVLVSPKGTVTLIDCDSFQVTANDRIFSCEVGVAHFTPPELQGQSFHGVHRTVNHDLFGLAVLIFHLLCMGRHPYAGRFVGTGEPPSIETAIEQFRYAYGRAGRLSQIVPPPQTLLLPAVMPDLADLFEQAFSRGSEQPGARPTETQWYSALKNLKSQLKPCPADIGHKFPNYLGTCPWCDLEREGAPNFFASVTAHLVNEREGELNASVDGVWNPLLNLEQEMKRCVLEKVSFQKLPVIPTPIPVEIEQHQSLARLVGRVVLGVLMTLAATFWIPLFLYTTVLLAIGFGTWWMILNRFYGIGPEIGKRHRRLEESIARLRRLEHDGAAELDSLRSDFRKELERLELTKAEIESLRLRYQADLDALHLQRERRQLDAFLQSHLIRQARIPLIDDWQKSTLESFGIETAFDLNEIRISNVDGFGPMSVSALMDWKRSVQKKFKFRPRQNLPSVDRNTILARYLRRREELEDSLAGGRASLELLVNQLQEVRSRFQQRLSAAAVEARQADADVLILPS
jgi:DNA-binding helix-hairpin-helix protein with protein kinase domain